MLFKLSPTIRERADELATLEAQDTGRSVDSALWTVNDICARRFEYYAGLDDKIPGDTFGAPGAHLSYTLREPIGATAHIVPWGSPAWIGVERFTCTRARRGVAAARLDMELQVRNSQVDCLMTCHRRASAGGLC